MAKKTKPSKRGVKTKNKSLHCSSKIKTYEKKLKKITRVIVFMCTIIRVFYHIYRFVLVFLNFLSEMF